MGHSRLNFRAPAAIVFPFFGRLPFLFRSTGVESRHWTLVTASFCSLTDTPMVYQIHPVEWESAFFGFPIGSLDIPADFSQADLQELLRQGQRHFRLIYVFRQGFGPETLEALDTPCVRYDQRITFKKVIARSVPPLDEHVKAYTSTICCKQLEALAITSGTMTRFMRDPELSLQYERLFLTWINNSVSGGLADSIWTWRENGKMIGLATVRCAKRICPENGQPEREGRIGMLAVHEQFRRKGIAGTLLRTCDYWCHSLDIPIASIITQSDNVATISLCKKLGYEQTETDSVYHCWSPGWVYDTRYGWTQHKRAGE